MELRPGALPLTLFEEPSAQLRPRSPLAAAPQKGPAPLLPYSRRRVEARGLTLTRHQSKTGTVAACGSFASHDASLSGPHFFV